MSAATTGRIEAGGDEVFHLRAEKQFTGEAIVAIGIDSQADARRLAACWNAMEGMPIEYIEKFSAHYLELNLRVGEYAKQLIEARASWPALVAARALLGDILKADDEALAELEALDMPPEIDGAVRAQTERIRAFLNGAGQLTTPDAAVRDAAWKATRMAAELGQVLTVRQIPRLPLAMGSYDTVVEVREGPSIYKPRMAADAALAAAVLNDTDPFNDQEADAAAVAKSIARHAAKTGGAQ